MSFLERADGARLKRFTICGEYRPDEELAEFNRLGTAPSVGGQWARSEASL